MPAQWICCQIGAREHYAVPRALQASGVVCRLLTDAWVPGYHVLAKLQRGLGERYHADLAAMPVRAWNMSLMARELWARSRKRNGWSATVGRDRWFQQKVVRELSGLESNGNGTSSTVFCYSYAARGILQYAKARGWRTILGQIDPGEEQEKLARELVKRNSALNQHWQPAPDGYWGSWREECAAADQIVVNSEWSKVSLMKAGMEGRKITVIPLAYDSPNGDAGFARQYPNTFDRSRPLRVLFLGQIILIKGVAEVLEAVKLLRNEPVEFWFVGRCSLLLPEELKSDPSVRWFGHVNRGEVGRFYREADVLLFPTWSDGFGLTQLEAQGWKLPVISSRFCGEVVRHGVNGMMLEEISGQAIASEISRLIASPAMLAEMSANSGVDSKFSLEAFGKRLLDLQ